jgi:uncharacterized membrane protein (DUF485 family)
MMREKLQSIRQYVSSKRGTKGFSRLAGLLVVIFCFIYGLPVILIAYLAIWIIGKPAEPFVNVALILMYIFILIAAFLTSAYLTNGPRDKSESDHQ